MKHFIARFVFCLPMAIGCNDSPRVPEKSPAKGGTVEVVAPGVNVEVEKRTTTSPAKVNVNAPGVNVNVEKKPG